VRARVRARGVDRALVLQGGARAPYAIVVAVERVRVCHRHVARVYARGVRVWTWACRGGMRAWNVGASGGSQRDGGRGKRFGFEEESAHRSGGGRRRVGRAAAPAGGRARVRQTGRRLSGVGLRSGSRGGGVAVEDGRVGRWRWRWVGGPRRAAGRRRSGTLELRGAGAESRRGRAGGGAGHGGQRRFGRVQRWRYKPGTEMKTKIAAR
jgi:hypothetical protein